MASADLRTRTQRDGAQRTRDRRVDVFVALGTGVVAIGLLLGLPPLDGLEPDGATLGMRVPAPFTAAWTVLALGLLVQSAALLAARRAPRTVLVAVSVLPVLVAALAPQSLDLFGLTALPVVVAVVLAALRVPLARLWPTLLVAAALVAAGSTVLSAVAGGALRGDVTQGLSGALGQGVLQAVGAVGLRSWSPCWCAPAARSAPPAPPRRARSSVNRTPWSRPRCPVSVPPWPANCTTSPPTTCPASP